MDIHYHDNKHNLPVVLFVHGFKGFKDWGHFNAIAQTFTQKDFVFVKMNTSCNGTTPRCLVDFDDLEAFGKNTFSMEVEDLFAVLDFVYNKIKYYGGNPENINLIGHSRGGGLAILVASKSNYVKKLATWASVANFDYFFYTMDIEKWKKEGVLFTYNSRTKQNMPLYFSLYEDYTKHSEHLDVESATKTLDKEWIIIHGEKDESVAVDAALALKDKNKKAILKIIKNANHTFGGKHPFVENKLPNETTELIEETIHFILAKHTPIM